ncbi:MAG: DNA repair protein RecO [Pseudomonadota bacterium]
MEFTDDGVILHVRPHGETHAVATVFTEHQGRWAGLVYGGQGRRKGSVLQPGNTVRAVWKGRNEDSLGAFSLELTDARAGFAMQDRLALAALTAICALALDTLPEREPLPGCYRALDVVLAAIDDPDLWPALMARFELGLLAALGFGLTLDRCAATGAREDLIYMSPRSAAAVSASAGEPYKDKLLPLPAFLRGVSSEADFNAAADALTTTGYFIESRILHAVGKELPEARRNIERLLRARADAA